MDLKKEILREHSRQNTLRIATWAGTSSSRFKQLMETFLHGEYRVTQRSAWIVRHCVVRHPERIAPYLDKMIERMLDPNVHVAVRRNVLGILEGVDIPKRLAGKITAVCFDFLESQQETIAVRAFSMTVLVNIARHEPDLRNELRLVIERHMPWGSAGFRSRGRKVLQQLSHMQKKETDDGTRRRSDADIGSL